MYWHFKIMWYNTLYKLSKHIYRGVEQLVARRAHNPEVASSSLVPATTKKADTEMVSAFSLLWAKHELATGGFPEHNSRALPVAEKAKAVMAQRSNNCHAPSEQLFGHRKSASKGKAFARNKFESCPRNHEDRTFLYGLIFI